MQANEMKEESFNQKQRTDISFNASNRPTFIKNHMHFKNFESSGKTSTLLDLYMYSAP